MRWHFPLLTSKARYWVEVALLSVGGIWLGHYLGENLTWLGPRYGIFRWMQDLLPRKTAVQHTFVVTIDDDDYWRGDFAARVPIRRDLLGVVIRKLADARARVIAVDFDLRSPVPDGASRELSAYQSETDALTDAVRYACARRSSVVLPATIDRNQDGKYIRRSEIYDQVSIASDRFFTGYIALNPDTRFVQLRIDLADGGCLPSFALAAVRAYRRASLPDIKSLSAFPFGGFVEPKLFPQKSFGQVIQLNPEVLGDDVGGKLVFVGSNWHSMSFGTGSLADSHMSPVGLMTGVFVHANYAEAMFSGNLYYPLQGWMGYLLEALVLFVLAYLLQKETPPLRKTTIIAAAAFVFLFVAYFLLANLSVYFDFLFPSVLLIAHSGVHSMLEWRDKARKWDEYERRVPDPGV